MSENTCFGWLMDAFETVSSIQLLFFCWSKWYE